MSKSTQNLRSSLPAEEKPCVSRPWSPTQLQGNYPPLTNHHETVQDNLNAKVFIHGGLNPSDQYEMPQPYLHVCDTREMRFTDLTDSLTYVTSGDPYSDDALECENRRLPSISGAGVTFVEINGHPMIFLVGGHDIGPDKPTSDVIAIHTAHHEWWYIKYANDKNGNARTPAARVDPTVVGCNNRLYIFGGNKQFDDHGKWTAHQSFSIMEFQEGKHTAEWLAVDVPYPVEVPQGQVFGRGIPIYNGTMILLLPGRVDQESKMDFEKDTIFYFITINNTFQKAKPMGELPKQIHWYSAFSMPSGTRATEPPSVMICTWLPYDDIHLSPEVWRYYVYPKDQVVRLNLNKRFFDLDLNLRTFSVIDDNMYLMGQGGDGDGEDEGAMCDTFVRVPIKTQEQH